MAQSDRWYELHITGTASLPEIIQQLQETVTRLKTLTPEEIDEKLPVKWEGVAFQVELY